MPKHHAEKENYLKTYVSDRTINYNLWNIHHWAYTLQDFHKLLNVLLNVTRSDSL